MKLTLQGEVISMRLSELQSGEKGYITKVRGHGAFRRRILEMGFVRGKEITVVKNAPLKDPIEYSLLGYQVSLRRSEAEKIEVSFEPFTPLSNADFIQRFHPEESSPEPFVNRGRVINVAFVGNPNAGKTSIFNFASNSNEHTGNYSGVTIDSKTASVEHDGYLLKMTDLPGTYSISAFSPEELYVRDYIINQSPDVVVNVVDASNLERNLYLTTQLIDMDVKLVLALNMFDEVEKRGDQIDFPHLSKLLGMPVVPTVGAKGRGVNELFQKVVNLYNDVDPVYRHIHVNYGTEIESSIQKIQELIKQPGNNEITDRVSPRFVALKLLERDRHAEEYILNANNYKEIRELAKGEASRLEDLFNEDTNTLITDSKYGYANGALKETVRPGVTKKREITEVLDGFLTHKLFGFPFFIFFLWLMFASTFYLGAYPQDWIETGVGWLSDFISKYMAEGSFKDLLVDGIIGGVGGVIVFLPNILILFFFISFMEDSGYMARAVFIMDKLMHKIGLHGKSFIPLIMGFGCNVPAIMATRTIEDRNNRLLTMLINPFMSCSARLPVYILLIGAIFPKYKATVLFGIYIFGILLAVGLAMLFKKVIFKTESAPFVMELPPYRMPTMRSSFKHMWNKGSQYLKKMGGVILVASIIMWALGYFPREVEMPNYLLEHKTDLQHKLEAEVDANMKLLIEQELSELEHEKEAIRLERSFIGRIGKAIEPAIRPLGYDWKMGVSLVSGIAAKEIVVSTLGVLYQADDSKSASENSLESKLQAETYAYGNKKGERIFTVWSTLSFLAFSLIYFPCVAVIAAVRKESGHMKWALFTVVYTTVLAWLFAFVIFQIGNILG